MITYEFKRIPKVDGFVMLNFEYKTVKKTEFEKMKKEGWILHRKKYFIYTYLHDLWLSFNKEQKIAVFGILAASIIGIIALFK